MISAKKILLAEDNENDAFHIDRALINLHCQVDVARNMQEARAMAVSIAPDLVILDVGLPRSFNAANVGFDEILSFIRDFKGRMASVVLTGFVDSAQVTEAMNAGACGYLDKSAINNPMELERGIREAYAVHLAIKAADPSAVALVQMATIRAGQVAVLALLRRMENKAGTVQDKKDEQFKKQIREAVIKERDAYWRKWIWGGINSLFWAGVGLLKFWGEHQKKH